LTTSH